MEVIFAAFKYKVMEGKNRGPIELMAPAGSYEAMMAAIKAGCNAVYFGVSN